jgi:hypothetical protein
LAGELRTLLASLDEAADEISVLETRSRLGACLAAMGNVDEAMRLLRDSYAAMMLRWKRAEPNKGKNLRRPLRQSIDRIVRFHERRGAADLAAAWRALQTLEFSSPTVEQATEATACWEKICQQCADEPTGFTNLGIACQHLAEACGQADKPDEAEVASRKAEEALGHALEIEPTGELARELLGIAESDVETANER